MLDTCNTTSTSAKMMAASAEPSGQLSAAPNWLCRTVATMVPLGPPTRTGATKSPKDRQKVIVAPATMPAVESGRMTRRKVSNGPAPSSCEASMRFEGMRSSAVKIGITLKGMKI